MLIVLRSFDARAETEDVMYYFDYGRRLIVLGGGLQGSYRSMQNLINNAVR
jgi:hypothetical protein